MTEWIRGANVAKFNAKKLVCQSLEEHREICCFSGSKHVFWKSSIFDNLVEKNFSVE